MKISGFSFVRNGIKLYYPIVEAIKSILPICDEFIIAVGQGDEDDLTRKLIAEINDPKIKIIDTVWEEEFFKKGIINSLQTDIAMKQCTGDWLFYIQADEVVHEKYLPVIKEACTKYLNDKSIEGLLFHYKHFWGDYNHYHTGHGWYPYEIRIVRNLPEIHSYQSAQSFRKFDFYDNPRQESGTHKLNVALIPAEIYHYGWVRPPHLMQNKRKALDSVHWGSSKAKAYYEQAPKEFDYGPMKLLGVFNDSHPAVMKDIIDKFNWGHKLYEKGLKNKYRMLHRHEKFKFKFLSLIEKIFLNGKQIGGFKNYILKKKMM